MKKRLLPMVLVCCLLSALLTVAAQADDVVASGNCGANGDNVKWALDSKGTLTISGKGAMADYLVTFWNDGSLQSQNIPWYANRSMITSLVVNDGVTGIGTFAFYALDRLNKVTLADSIIRIKERAFENCTSMTKITLPDSVASIEDGVFWKCSNLLNFTISEHVTSIGASAFRDCDRLTKMVIPNNVENISVNAFRECDRLTSVTIWSNISALKARTFRDCPALAEVTIPDSVLIMEENAFSGCDALKDVYFTGTESMWKEISMDSGNEPLESANIHYDTSPEAAYRINALSISDTDGKALRAIPESAFLATVSVTNRASGATPIIFLASYDAKGQYQGLAYVTVKEPVGGTVEVTLPVDNSGGNVAQLKAFAVKSFSGMEVIGNPVSFPA